MRLFKLFFIIMIVTIFSSFTFADNTETSPNSPIIGKIIELSKEDKSIQIDNISYLVSIIEWLSPDNQRTRASFSNLKEGMLVHVIQGDELEASIYKALLVTIPEDQFNSETVEQTTTTSSSTATTPPSNPLDADNSYKEPKAEGAAPVLKDGVWTN